ncbi:hypothetical protein ACFYP0_27855 [Micromonospora arida]|uniref:hypothetical protein n=1 Tax=Micromonospora arida TaxID=2203715 RepID=UPI003686A5E5
MDRLSARAGVDLRTALRKLSLLEELSMVVRRDDGYALAPSANRKRAAAETSARPVT